MERTKKIHSISPVARIFPLSWLIRFSGQNVFLPFWHAVNDSPQLHYNQLFHVPGVSGFSSTLDYLLKFNKPVTFQEYAELKRNGIKSTKPIMHLSFDDGLRECYEVIAPILHKKGIPATFFINPAFIGNGSMFYRFKISLLINQMKRKNIPECMLSGITTLMMENEISFSSLENGLFKISYTNSNLLDDAAKILGVDFNKYLHQARPYMTQEEVRSISSQGFTIGAHSIDHPDYSLLNENEQVEQTVTSIERVTMEYGLPYMTFAFPFTDHLLPVSFWEKLARRLGQDVLTFGTSGLKEDLVFLSSQRTPMEIKGMNGMEIIKSEYLYHLLKKPFGKNKLLRK